MPDLRDFVTTEQLKDGTAVTVRAVRPDDKGRIIAAFRELEAERSTPDISSTKSI